MALEESKLISSAKGSESVKSERFFKILHDKPFRQSFDVNKYILNQPLLVKGYHQSQTCYPMLVLNTEKRFIEPHVYENQLTSEELTEMNKLPISVRRFYKRRHFLFKKYSNGIQLDEESWYSVIPECISKYIAEKIYSKVKKLQLKDPKVIDGFCGSGGLAIQFALYFKNFEAVDIDPIKIENIQNNMTVYGLKFPTHSMSYFDILPRNQIDQEVILIMCPPWGGMEYLKQNTFDLMNHMNPNLYEILKKAFTISSNFVIQLPKNIEVKQLRERNLKLKRFAIEVESMYVNDQLNQIIVYFGDLVQPSMQTEREMLYNEINKCNIYNIKLQKENDQKIHNSLKKKVKKLGIVSLYKLISQCEQNLIQENQLKERFILNLNEIGK